MVLSSLKPLSELRSLHYYARVQTTTHQLGTTLQAERDAAPTYFYQGLAGSWQFFLEGCRASHRGLKHSFSVTVCLNHTVIHKYLANKELYLTFSKYVDKLLVVKSLINILKLIYFNIVFYSFFIDICGLINNLKLTSWIQLACLNASWHVSWHVGI